MDREYRNRLIGVIQGRGAGGPFSNGRDDWENFYRWIVAIQRGDPARRPVWQDVQDVLTEALSGHPDWIRELTTAYARGIDLLDHVGAGATAGTH